jgi:hypothetical protein
VSGPPSKRMRCALVPIICAPPRMAAHPCPPKHLLHVTSVMLWLIVSIDVRRWVKYECSGQRLFSVASI